MIVAVCCSVPTARVPVVVVAPWAFGENLAPNRRLSLNASGCNDRFLVLVAVRGCVAGVGAVVSNESGDALLIRTMLVALTTTRHAPPKMSVFHFRDILSPLCCWVSYSAA